MYKLGPKNHFATGNSKSIRIGIRQSLTHSFYLCKVKNYIFYKTFFNFTNSLRGKYQFINFSLSHKDFWYMVFISDFTGLRACETRSQCVSFASPKPPLKLSVSHSILFYCCKLTNYVGAVCHKFHKASCHNVADCQCKLSLEWLVRILDQLYLSLVITAVSKRILSLVFDDFFFANSYFFSFSNISGSLSIT